ncbi:hypothetical protein [Agromyces bracchium]|uniref:Uncharacterized protein n=1 Tax=Agromyces bracchium TaxID=88376 RepID=A0A6I3M649_9MICO|nr:hypothetical protein [Agromyces bracchium]MTH70100.1 hypothetical protein [Agromyces bracchium]
MTSFKPVPQDKPTQMSPTRAPDPFVELSREGENKVTIPFVAGKSKLSDEGVEKTLVVRNVEILGPTPYIGGTVNVAIGLVASVANDYFDNLVGVLESFSDALGGKALSESLNMVEPLKEGAESLLGIGDLRPIVGVQNGFDAAEDGGIGVLKTGLYAVVNVDESENFGPWLPYQNDQLMAEYKDGKTRPVDFDYLVFRIEATGEMPDYRRFPTLNRLKSKVMEAAIADPKLRSKAYKDAIAAFDLAVLADADLVGAHRVQIRDGIRKEVRQIVGVDSSAQSVELDTKKGARSKSIAASAKFGPKWDRAVLMARRIT